jgi:hypothetical protein
VHSTGEWQLFVEMLPLNPKLKFARLITSVFAALEGRKNDDLHKPRLLLRVGVRSGDCGEQKQKRCETWGGSICVGWHAPI